MSDSKKAKNQKKKLVFGGFQMLPLKYCILDLLNIRLDLPRPKIIIFTKKSQGLSLERKVKKISLFFLSDPRKILKKFFEKKW